MARRCILLVGVFTAAGASFAFAADDDVNAEARREVLRKSYGTYAGELRTPDGRIDIPRLAMELKELKATSYNYLIARADTDWDDLKRFLPIAEQARLRVWVTILPPSESPPRLKRFSEPFRLDFEKWGVELARLSLQYPALVAWSIDDFVHNLRVADYNKDPFTPERTRRMVEAARKVNPRFAFVPCVYFKQATPEFCKTYGPLLDGILFPYRSESTTPNLKNPEEVGREVAILRERFGKDFPIIIDIYATAHSRLGASTPEYVERLMLLSYPVADGVHIYRHQNQRDPKQKTKYDIIRRIMSSWSYGSAKPIQPPPATSTSPGL